MSSELETSSAGDIKCKSLMVSVSEAPQKRPGLVPEDLQASIIELLEKCKEYVDILACLFA